MQWLGNDRYLDSTGYSFYLTSGMLLPIPMYRPVAPEFLIDGICGKCGVTVTPASVSKHTWPVTITVDTARVESVTINSNK